MNNTHTHTKGYDDKIHIDSTKHLANYNAWYEFQCTAMHLMKSQLPLREDS